MMIILNLAPHLLEAKHATEYSQAVTVPAPLK
jgi:hypothetical protein